MKKKARIESQGKSAGDSPEKVGKRGENRTPANPTKRPKSKKSKAPFKSAEYVPSDAESADGPLVKGDSTPAAGPTIEPVAIRDSGEHGGAYALQGLTKNLVPLTVGGLSVSDDQHR